MRNLLLQLVLLTASLSTFSQGIVRGKITDEKGESLIGVTITLKSNKLVGVFTDLDGNYSIKIPDSIPQTIVISYISYSNIEDNISALKNNEVLIKNYAMSTTETALQEVEVVAKQVRANEYFMENIKKNSANTIDYISASTMKKTGDANVTSAVARVSGVSTSGGLITVRGMGDRYVKTTFNGSIIPTLDPLTNNIKLEMFPSSLVDNIIFTKTASPDLRGDWSGAYISVETKDYPEKLTVNVETQIGYNQQSSFKDVISSSRSKTDWLGYDDGLRERTQKHSEYNHPTLDNTGNSTLSTYDEMVALGLGDYYTSLGVTNFNSSDNTPYFKLGLVKLGILAPALIDDPTAIGNATYLYNTIYKKQAFDKLNPNGADYNNGFANNWDTKKRRAPLNFSQSFGIGNQTTLFGKPLGYILGFRYGSSVRYDPNGVSNRLGYVNNGTQNILGYSNNDNVDISRETNGWSALLNLAYKINSNNTLSFLCMPNLTGTNDVIHYSSQNLVDDVYNHTKNQFYEQRKQMIYQLKTEHFISKPKIKIDFNGSYTEGKSNVPDFKSISYKELDGLITELSPTAGVGIKRFYRYLSENILDTRLSLEMPIGKISKAGVRKIKIGAAYEENNRKSETYGYQVNNGNSNVINNTATGDLNSYLDPSKFIMYDGKVDYLYAPSLPDNTYNLGMSVIKSAFLLADYSIIPALRVSGGLRVEKTNIFTNVNKYYDDYKYTKNDLRMESDSGEINQLNYLPSVNVIYKVLDNGKALVNSRINFSQTLARPSIRELSNYRVYDNEFRNGFIGNPKLKMAQIQNYDFRLESYFKNGDNVSVSLFYKQIKNNIEMAFGGGEGITWINVDTTIVKGFEFEGKKNITKFFELRANVTIVKSQTKYTTNYGRFDRTMFGQAPYIINAMLVYTADSIGLTATVGYNVQGPKLVIVDLLPQNPYVYELPRHTIDIKLSKTLGKNFSVSFTVRDLLNAPIRREYRGQDGKKIDSELKDFNYDKFRYGTNFILGVSYKL